MSQSKRKTPHFISTFNELLREVPGSPLFKTWSALWCVSAAIERKLWVTTMGSPVYPNIYVMLIGSSGAGKGTTMPTARELVMSLGDQRVGASSMTSAYVTWAMQANTRQFVNPVTNMGETYHAINIFSPELQVLFSQYDPDMLSRLTDMWDARDYSEGRKDEKKTFFCERSCTTMLMGTTATHLHTTLPATAWSMGFMSRTIMVFAPPVARRSLFLSMDSKTRAEVLAALKHDLKMISHMKGEYFFNEEAAKLLDAFYTFPGNQGGPPIPDHPNLLSYCERRHHQLEKMMILFAAAEDQDNRILTAEHYHLAHELLLETEASMPDVFSASAEGSDLDKANKILHTLWKSYKTNKDRPIPYGAVFKVCMRDTTSFHANILFEMLVRTGNIRRAKPDELTEAERGRGVDHYIPLSMSFGKD